MTQFKQYIATVAAVALTAGMLVAQAPPPPGGAAAGRGGRGTPPPAVRSPEVNADRTVTFRLRAPEGTAVQLAGEVTQGKGVFVRVLVSLRFLKLRPEGLGLGGPIDFLQIRPGILL